MSPSRTPPKPPARAPARPSAKGIAPGDPELGYRSRPRPSGRHPRGPPWAARSCRCRVYRRPHLCRVRRLHSPLSTHSFLLTTSHSLMSLAPLMSQWKKRRFTHAFIYTCVCVCVCHTQCNWISIETGGIVLLYLWNFRHINQFLSLSFVKRYFAGERRRKRRGVGGWVGGEGNCKVRTLSPSPEAFLSHENSCHIFAACRPQLFLFRRFSSPL